MIDLKEKLIGIVRDVVGNISPDDSKDGRKKRVTLRVNFERCTVEDVIQRALSPIKINYVNTTRIKGWDIIKALPDVIELYANPAGVKAVADPKAAILAQFPNMDAKEQEEFIETLQKQRKIILRKAAEKEAKA